MIERLGRRDTNFTREISYVNASDYDHFDLTVAKSGFAASFVGDCYTFGISRYMHATLVDVVEAIAEALRPILGSRPICTFLDGHAACLNHAQHFLLTIEDRGQPVGDIWELTNRRLIVSGFGPADIIKPCRSAVYAIFKDGTDRLPTIKWHYSNGGRRCTANSEFQQPKPSYDAFYPWIKEGTAAYFDAYARSDEAILVLLGEPGTGKTSFIRNLIWHTKWDAAFTYDEALLHSDELFVEFMTQDESNLLIIEDADVFLTSRQHDANKLMARFLNVSDGLFTPKHRKKLLFTANLLDHDEIDRALLREGRCFDCMTFRPLSQAEVATAARVAGLSVPDHRGPMSLAQLFAKQDRGLRDLKKTEIGFRV